ncbi:hypothetical protein [Roseibium sp.]|uniref:hypothetical protein n=1 Tax=Roseibium sp. TaxID=1936156 RepID=UPI003A9864FD
MRAKTIAIFGISYAVILGAGVVTFIIAIRLAGWDASFQKIVKQTGFALNMIAFALAIGVALSRRVHDRLGGAPGPITFRLLLAESRPVITVGFAFLAMLIDVCALKLASWYFAGEMAAPSLLRLVVLVGAYCVIAWILMSDFKTKTKTNGARFERR